MGLAVTFTDEEVYLLPESGPSLISIELPRRQTCQHHTSLFITVMTMSAS